MLPVKELRGLAAALPSAEFRKQLGPFVLIQRPPGKAGGTTNKMGLPAAARTTQVVSAKSVMESAMPKLPTVVTASVFGSMR